MSIISLNVFISNQYNYIVNLGVTYKEPMPLVYGVITGFSFTFTLMLSD